MRKIELRPVEGLKSDPSQPRKHFDEEELRRLGESLKIRQNDPIQILPDGTIIDGERRWRGGKLAGIEKLEVIVTDKLLSPRELTRIRLTTFFHRADLKPIERCRAVAEFMEQNPELDQAGAAKELNVSEGTMTHLLAYRRCAPEVQKALEDDQITVSDVYTLSKAALEDQPGLLNFRLTAKPSRTALQAQVKKAGNRPPADSETQDRTVKRVKIAVASSEAYGQVTVASPDEEIDLERTETLLKEALKLVRSAKDKSLTIRSAVAVWADMAKAGA